MFNHSVSPSVTEFYNLHKVMIEDAASGYLKDLHLSWKSIKNKAILDLGAGKGYFGIAAKIRNIDVTSVDTVNYNIYDLDSSFVQADFLKLGNIFSNKLFDLIIARYSLSLVTNNEEITLKVNNAMRLLVNNGEFRIYPNFITRKLDPIIVRRFLFLHRNERDGSATENDIKLKKEYEEALKKESVYIESKKRNLQIFSKS